jgi:hypothetical protein
MIINVYDQVWQRLTIASRIRVLKKYVLYLEERLTDEIEDLDHLTDYLTDIVLQIFKEQ